MGDLYIGIVGAACALPGCGTVAGYWEKVVQAGDRTDTSSSAPPVERTGGSEGSALHRYQDGQGGFYRLQLSKPLRRMAAACPFHQDLLILNLVETALEDAGLGTPEVSCGDIDVLVVRQPVSSRDGGKAQIEPQVSAAKGGAYGEDAFENIEPTLKALLSELFGINGDCRTLQGEGSRLAEALHWAQWRLREGASDAVVVVGIDLAPSGSAESEGVPQHSTIGMEGAVQPRATAGTAEGGGAVVLRRADAAELNGRPVYALVKGIGLTGRGVSSPEKLTEISLAAMTASLEAVEVTPATLGYLEFFSGGWVIDPLYGMAGIGQFFGADGKLKPPLPMGAAEPSTRCQGPAGAALALIKAALVLSKKIFPPSPPGIDACAAADGFFAIEIKARPWIHDRSLPPRRAGICMSGDGLSGLILLEEVRDGGEGLTPWPLVTGLPWESELVVFSGESHESLLKRLDALAEALSGNRIEGELPDIAFSLVKDFDPAAAHRLAMVCREKTHLVDAIHRFSSHRGSGMPAAEEDGIYYRTGACRQKGKVACLFPGLVGLNFDGPNVRNLEALCLHFPEVREIFDMVDHRDGSFPPTRQFFFSTLHSGGEAA